MPSRNAAAMLTQAIRAAAISSMMWLEHMATRRVDIGLALGREGLDAQSFDEPAKHLAHERGEAGPRQPVVKGLVRDGDAVLMIELAQQIRDRFDGAASEPGDRRQEQACGVTVRSRLLWPVLRPSWLTSSTDSARPSADRILARCEVDNAVSDLLAC
jgi:hypothetical protein